MDSDSGINTEGLHRTCSMPIRTKHYVKQLAQRFQWSNLISVHWLVCAYQKLNLAVSDHFSFPSPSHKRKEKGQGLPIIPGFCANQIHTVICNSAAHSLQPHSRAADALAPNSLETKYSRCTRVLLLFSAAC